MSDLGVIEFDKVMERLEGDKELFHELVAIFLDTHGQSVGAIRAAIQAGVAADVGAAAHAIKGALGNLGAARAQAAALALERAGKDGRSAEFAQLLQTLESEVKLFLSEYQSRRQEF